MEPLSRRRWPRLVIVVPPWLGASLREMAEVHLREPRQEALRLLMDGVAREQKALKDAADERQVVGTR